ncbi:Uncharacterised protein family UPF0272 [Plasmopara halstedii]|uniref:Uncharacterized protein family UPF0272 n=1 Tax=Plasmopara halstedii TaxID=4781 RepID=A0A0N7L8L1_PLAHL|nr:Uncharacterised protein family UPF0272 [Plasmopara halstedii]CEG50179.1 Uncharacterised protein family UPF0272 [Plasmopara halstedii]|eukprot:XP_024586548.1 Uncharacterised protein family UPF0272 [Plasmopara halstedii]
MSGPIIAFIDCSAGIAGDMLLGALIDAGAPVEEIKRGLESLHGIKGEWGLSASRTQFIITKKRGLQRWAKLCTIIIATAGGTIMDMLMLRTLPLTVRM